MSYAETSWHHHYVSVVDGQRSGMLLGPFRTRQEAEARVDEVRRYAQERNRDAIWYGFGTSRVTTAREPRPGLLNDHLPHLISR